MLVQNSISVALHLKNQFAPHLVYSYFVGCLLFLEGVPVTLMGATTSFTTRKMLTLKMTALSLWLTRLNTHASSFSRKLLSAKFFQPEPASPWLEAL